MSTSSVECQVIFSELIHDGDQNKSIEICFINGMLCSYRNLSIHLMKQKILFNERTLV